MKQSKCRVCTHPDQAAIEAGISAGRPYRVLAQEFHVSSASLSRHKAHLEAPADASLLDAADRIIDELRSVAQRVKRNRNLTQSVDLSLKVSKELRAWLTLRAQLIRQAPAVPAERHPDLDSESMKNVDEILRQRLGKANQ